MAKLIKGTHHIALKCEGTALFEKTITFYRDVLGMDVVRAWGESPNRGMMLSTGNSLMEIFENGPDTLPQGAIRHFALATDDVDACVAAAEAYGCKCTVRPADMVIGSVPPFPIRMAFVIGPAGEEVEFFTER